MNTDALIAWITEREAIRSRRGAGQPRPWTTDPILAQWRFCNVRRESDRVTIWIREHWRDPHADDPDIWFAMAVARLVNWPDTMAALGYPVPWNREQFIATLQTLTAQGQKAWGDAYNISNAGKSLPKVEVVAGVLDALRARRKVLRPRDDDSLLSFYSRLKDMRGFASFMAGQVVADAKQVGPLRNARDWWSFAAPGPGSSQDLQNCLCEFDKFERVRLGEGKPKRRF